MQKSTLAGLAACSSIFLSSFAALAQERGVATGPDVDSGTTPEAASEPELGGEPERSGEPEQNGVSESDGEPAPGSESRTSSEFDTKGNSRAPSEEPSRAESHHGKSGPEPSRAKPSGAAPSSPEPREADASSAQSSGEQSGSAPADDGEVTLVLPKPNQGHYLRLGLHGLAAMASDDKRGARDATFGTGFSIGLGEAVTDWFDLGLEFAFGSTGGAEEDSLTLGRFTVLSRFYPAKYWFIQAGFGATNGQGSDPEDLSLNRGRYGDVYLAGLGANLYLSDSNGSGGWVLTPVLSVEVGPDSDFTTTAAWVGLEISWWSGLSSDKLDLPLEEAYE